MKASKLKLGLLMAAIIPFLMACPKPRQTAPQPDTETQSSVDISRANLMITDIDMICSFIGTNDPYPDFYMPQPDQPSGAYLSLSNPNVNKQGASFVNAKCVDGKLREGTIYLEREVTTPQVLYYEKYGYKAEITLSEYKVDGWRITTIPGIRCYVSNNLSSSTFDPKKTNLSWTIEGTFVFEHPTDPSQNMKWTGKLIKTLVNTSDKNVFDPSKPVAINWSLAKVEYYGEATGVTSANVPFDMSVHSANPLTRDFTCSSDMIGGVSSVQPLKTWKNEFHPFIEGIVSFTTGSKYPRQIYYGNEGNQDLANQCDNSGQVLIKGNTYVVNF